MSETLDKQTIAHEIQRQLNKRGIEFEEIGIRGSRAIDHSTDNSDWDFYAVIEQPVHIMDFITISNETAKALGLPLTTSLECTFEKDKSKCIDFKFVNNRPVTGRELITRAKTTYPEHSMFGNMILRDVA